MSSTTVVSGFSCHIDDTSTHFIHEIDASYISRTDYKPTDEEVNTVKGDFGGNLTIPENFEQTVPVFDPDASKKKNKCGQAQTMVNPQTTLICSMLDLVDPNAVFLGKDSTYKLPDDQENSPEGASDDDDVDEDYESEPSFILSGSEQSFSDKSFSLLSQNDSFTDNPDEISVNDSNNSSIKFEVSERVNEENGVTEQEMLNAQKLTLAETFSPQLPLRKSLSVEEMSDLVAVQQKAKLKLNLSQSSASTSESDEKDGAQAISLSDSSLECKYLEISDDDPELREMLTLQRRQTTVKDLSEGNIIEISSDEKAIEISEDEKNSADEKVLDVSTEDEDLEFQEILAAQKKNQETIPDLQTDLDIKPVYQSSPAVSMDDRADESLNSNISPKSAQKRDIMKMRTFESPMMKKFKRRNSDIYFDQSIDEEEDKDT